MSQCIEPTPDAGAQPCVVGSSLLPASNQITGNDYALRRRSLVAACTRPPVCPDRCDVSTRNRTRSLLVRRFWTKNSTGSIRTSNCGVDSLRADNTRTIDKAASPSSRQPRSRMAWVNLLRATRLFVPKSSSRRSSILDTRTSCSPDCQPRKPSRAELSGSGRLITFLLGI
jgi:hypothetical protein